MKLSEIKARCEAATPGPWEVLTNPSRTSFDCIYSDSVRLRLADVFRERYLAEQKENNQNVEFIVHSRTDIPALVDWIDRARAHLDILHPIE